MNFSIYKKITVVFIGFVALIVIAGLVMKMRSEQNVTTALSPQSYMAPEVTESTDILDSDRDIAPVQERSEREIGTLLTKIESATDGDATALDEEVSDEARSIQEGRLVIQEMGQGYDETSY